MVEDAGNGRPQIALSNLPDARSRYSRQIARAWICIRLPHARSGGLRARFYLGLPLVSPAARLGAGSATAGNHASSMQQPLNRLDAADVFCRTSEAAAGRRICFSRKRTRPTPGEQNKVRVLDARFDPNLVGDTVRFVRGDGASGPGSAHTISLLWETPRRIFTGAGGSHPDRPGKRLNLPRVYWPCRIYTRPCSNRYNTVSSQRPVENDNWQWSWALAATTVPKTSGTIGGNYRFTIVADGSKIPAVKTPCRAVV